MSGGKVSVVRERAIDRPIACICEVEGVGMRRGKGLTVATLLLPR